MRIVYRRSVMMNAWVSSIMDGTRIFGVYVMPVFLAATFLQMLLLKRCNFMKMLAQTAFLYYICCVFALVFLPLPTMEQAAALFYKTELMPFHCILSMMKDPVGAGLQVVMNIIMTIPFGMFLRYYFKMDAGRVFLYSLALTTFIEFGQFSGLFLLYKGSYRLFEVDDLICNTLGGMIGFAAMKKVEGFIPEMESFERIFKERKLELVK